MEKNTFKIQIKQFRKFAFYLDDFNDYFYSKYARVPMKQKRLINSPVDRFCLIVVPKMRVNALGSREEWKS